MYRRYEDPGKLQIKLKIAECKLAAAMLKDPDNDDRIMDLAEDVESLRDRLRFAWDDEEYDENYARENYGYDEYL